jgi:hypothetical protein
MSADTVTPPPVPLAKSAAPKRSRRRKWGKRLLPLATLLVLGAFFAPAVVAKTELRNRLARQALADLRGNVHVGDASLGWLSPVELRDVTVTDEAGRTLVSIPRIRSQKALVVLARNADDPGAFVIEEATVNVVCEKGTTNLETAFAEYLKDDGQPPAPTRTPVAVRVTNATVTITDAETNKTASIEGVAATATVPASRAEPVTATVTAATGKLDAQLSIGATNSVKLVAQGFPLDTLAPLLKRVEPGVSVAGLMSADVKATWGKEPNGVLNASASGTVGAKQLAVGGPALNGDTLRFDSADLPLDVEVTGHAVRVRRFDLTCDVGTLSVAGAFDPAEEPDAMLKRAGIVVGADVELAKLAAKLPKLVRVKDGTELREGKLKIDVASKADADGKGATWTGTVRTSAIKAVRDGKAISWDEPLNVEFVGRYAPGAFPTFDKLVCTSDFIAVNARTTPNTVQVAATVYLHKLGAKLHEFLDLGGFSLAGEATAGLGAGREPDGAFQAVGTVELKGFAYTDRNGKGLSEPALKVQLSAAGVAPASGPVRLSAAAIDLTAGGDELHLKLLEPVADVRQLADGGVDVSVKGDIARWKARAAAVTKIPAYQMSGTLAVGGKAKLAADRVTVERLTVKLTNVTFRGAGIVLDEPAVNAVGDFTLTRATKSATITKMTLTSAPLTVTEGTLSFDAQPNGDVFVTGSGPCVADLNRLGAAVKLYPDRNGPDALHGRGVGPLRFRAAGDVTTFGGTLDVTNFAYGPKDKAVWAEPTLRLEADGEYRDSADAVALAAAKVSRPGLDLDVKGTVAKATTTQEVDFSGHLRYDWAKLTPLMREFVGKTFTATGSGSRAVTVSGTLAPPGAVTVAAVPAKVELKAPGAPAKPAAGPGALAAVNAEAAVGWESLSAYGFDIGANELRAKVTRGVVAVTPVYATFGGGKVIFAPTLHLEKTPGEMTLAKGHVLDHVKLTPAATASALGYALPAIANAGQAEGEISYVVADNRIVLDDYTQSTVTSAVVIHKATVGASPAIAKVAELLGVKGTTMTLAIETVVPVQVKDGRVHHQGFAMNFAGTPLRTSGSVGFDNTLDLIVEVPLPKDIPALKNNPLLMKAIAGKWVKVPVKGTLSKPEVDPKGFEKAVAELAREGAKDVGKEAIENELKKLFQKKP